MNPRFSLRTHTYRRVIRGTELTVCVRPDQDDSMAYGRPRHYGRWYRDEEKRLEVVVWFLERRVNKSRRKEPGTITERLDRVVKRLRSRGRGHDYDNIMKILSSRDGFGYRLTALETGLRIGTVKQTVRRLDQVAYELFSSES
jgi:hypothetical protein